MPTYTKEMVLPDARLAFRIKSKMIDLKPYYKGKKQYKADGYKCEMCWKEVETITHCMECEGYNDERENLDLDNDYDLVQFFTLVMKKRSDKI